MHRSFDITSEPASEPLTLAQAKNHLKIDTSITEDDDLITALIKIARQTAEKYCRRLLYTQTQVMRLDYFYNLMEINRTPIQSISSIKYYDSDNTLQTLSTDYYDVDVKSSPARITLKYGATYPTIKERTNAIEITFVAGWQTVAAIPENIISGMYLLIGHLYENRESVVIGKIVNELPMGVKYLWDLDRIYVFN